MIDIISTVQTGAAIYKIAAFFLSDVFDEIGQVYVDMADSHLKSAQQAFGACEKSTDPESEIRAGLSHLRDSYNIYSTAIHREVTKGILIFKHTDRPHLNDKICPVAINIAALISLLYRELGEVKNANDWRTEASESYDFYIDNYYFDEDGGHDTRSLRNLAAIDKDYVTVERIVTTNYPAESTEISRKGREYIRELREEKKKLMELLA